ncbi:MAG: hypothetical protein OEV21_06285 [Thermoplasmata archaeon]|nr:hypothetical protein [Thermoplasmata archaeon]
MEGNKSRPIAIALVITVILSGMFIGLSSTLAGAPDRAVARTQADIVFAVGGPSQLISGDYTDIVGTDEIFEYSALSTSVPNANFTWTIETEYDSTVIVYGKTLRYGYHNVGNYSIYITARTPEGGDATTKHINVQVLLDFDEDGIADWWERYWFGTTTDATNTSDSDGDGWTDLEEYDRQTNPTEYTYKAGFLDEYWWLIVLIVIIAVLLIFYLFVMRPKMESTRKEEEQKKIAAAVEIEKTLMSFDELEEKGKK